MYANDSVYYPASIVASDDQSTWWYSKIVPYLGSSLKTFPASNWEQIRDLSNYKTLKCPALEVYTLDTKSYAMNYFRGVCTPGQDWSLARGYARGTGLSDHIRPDVLKFRNSPYQPSGLVLLAEAAESRYFMSNGDYMRDKTSPTDKNRFRHLGRMKKIILFCDGSNAAMSYMEISRPLKGSDAAMFNALYINR